jgi:predicted RNA binding protein YcfA (HicA-like mRNA interferase family)
VRNVQRHDVARWLQRNGFVADHGRTGHVQYRGHGVVVTLQGHGPQDLTKKHWAMIRRTLAAAGFDPNQVEREL